ncbi:hypothetical protein GCM10010129_76460 [Streptomyces fumigatiscleroticus]|nr:hypothetical protein GCM10010129_76460 [Streptomyces fumigatiscleroticus]
MLVDEIDAVDWAAIPTPRLRVPRVGREVPEWFDLPSPAPGLRALARATTIPAVAEAASLLAGSALLWEHMGAVFPAAVAAAPFLLRIAEREYVHARDAALGLLSDMLCSYPFADYNRVRVPDGSTPALCCAVAEAIRSRRDFLLTLGKPGKRLLALCDEHWRFEIREVVRDGADVIALGYLSGSLPSSGPAGELHHNDGLTALDALAPEYPLDGDTPEACLRIAGAAAGGHCGPGGIILPAACGLRIH